MTAAPAGAGTGVQMNAISRSSGWRGQAHDHVAVKACATVAVQVTEHAGRGHRPPTIHFDPPSAGHVLRLVLAEIRRAAEDLHISREPDGRLALRAGPGEAHAPLAYIEGLGTADAILTLAELARR